MLKLLGKRSVNRGQDIYLAQKYFSIDYLIVAKKKPYFYKSMGTKVSMVIKLSITSKNNLYYVLPDLKQNKVHNIIYHLNV